MSLLLWSSLAFSWTFITVEAEFSPDERAYVRCVKKKGVNYWYLVMPDRFGFVVYPVTNIYIFSEHVCMNSAIHGTMILPIVRPAKKTEEFHFIFAIPDPFRMRDLSSIDLNL